MMAHLCQLQPAPVAFSHAHTHLPPVQAIATSAFPSLSCLAAVKLAPATSFTYSPIPSNVGQSSSKPCSCVCSRFCLLRGELERSLVGAKRWKLRAGGGVPASESESD